MVKNIAVSACSFKTKTIAEAHARNYSLFKTECHEDLKKIFQILLQFVGIGV